MVGCFKYQFNFYYASNYKFLNSKRKKKKKNLFNEIAKRIKNRSNGDVAVDQYHRYKVDMLIPVHKKSWKENHSY